MCIVILKKRGLLAYDDYVTKYIPDFPFNNITIRHLLTHSSGITDYINLTYEQWQKYPNATDKDISKIIKENFSTLQFQPGEKFLYSNSNYSFLVNIIESISKCSYQKFIYKNIFKPLKMKHSFIKTENCAMRKSIKGYIKKDSVNVIELPEKLNSLFGSPTYRIIGGGGVFSNLEDLWKWDKALNNSALVNSNDLKDIFTKHKFNDGTESRYGFGWNIYNRDNGDIVVRHAGQFVGYLSIITRNITRKETVVILTNLTYEGDVQNIVALMTQIEKFLETEK